MNSFSHINVFIAAAAGISMLAFGSAQAAAIVLDFEGAGNNAAVNDFYNGGTDSDGNSGIDYGISFSNTSLALVDADAGGNGNFANEPSPNTILFFLSGGAATLNVFDGFDTGFSFFYTAINNPGSVVVYDGLDGSGNVLASLKLSITSSNCMGDPAGAFCQFDPVGVAFDGIAKSVDFAGVADQVGFDDVTFGSVTAGGPGNGGPGNGNPGTDVPEPGAIALLGLGLLLFGRRRRWRCANRRPLPTRIGIIRRRLRHAGQPG